MSKAAELANLIGNINAGGGGVNKNVIINGAMNVAQRRTSATSIGNEDVFILDRFFTSQVNSNGVLSMSQDSSAPSGFANSLKLDCTTADTSIASAEILTIQHKIEGQNLQAFAKGTSDAKPFAVSFYVKGNASATYVCELFDADNSRQISKSFNVTTDWTRVELSFPADTTGTFDDDNANSLFLVIWLHAGSSYTSGTRNSSSWAANTTANRVGSGTTSFYDSTDRTFFLTGVQLEVGQNPTAFEHEPFERTLAKCHRYYYALLGTIGGSNGQEAHVCTAGAYNDTTAYGGVPFPVTMRATPTLVHLTGTNYWQFYNANHADTFDGFTMFGENQSNSNKAFIYNADTVSTTNTNAGNFQGNNSGCYLHFTAEL
tara:strand:+ start:105 stop:1226 length:1122 start_codon:yes stop_codon:yes gene_type:complete